MHMYKTGVVGDYDSICAFAALGLDIVAAESVKEAEEAIKNMASSEYGIIYVTEQFYKELGAVTDIYRETVTPAIIPIPSVRGSEGIGINRMKKFVEQAVGSDIIFND